MPAEYETAALAVAMRGLWQNSGHLEEVVYPWIEYYIDSTNPSGGGDSNNPYDGIGVTTFNRGTISHETGHFVAQRRETDPQHQGGGDHQPPLAHTPQPA